MKFVQLVLLLLFISILVLVSCKEHDQKQEEPLGLDSINLRFINPYTFSDSVLMKKTLIVYLDDSTNSFNGIFEDESYGIGFFVLSPLDTINIISYKSQLLDGIGDGSVVDTLTFLSEKYLYYNSGSAFIGSRNLEIYQYLFNPSTREIYKSYTALSEDGSVTQIFSQNLKDNSKNELKYFFQKQVQLKYIDDIAERKTITKYER